MSDSKNSLTDKLSLPTTNTRTGLNNSLKDAIPENDLAGCPALTSMAISLSPLLTTKSTSQSCLGERQNPRTEGLQQNQIIH